MARPATSLTPKVSDFHTVDITWLRRKGARHVGYSGSIKWSRNGTPTGSIGYSVEAGGLRLCYRTTPRGGEPEDIDELIPITTTPMHLGSCRHWFCASCWRRCRILLGGALPLPLCRGAGTKANTSTRP
jgi:hypothetical protein